VTNPPEDMESTIRRSPLPRENEWTPTLNGTLRMRGNDPRKCKDEVPEELKFHHSPPPPPSPTTNSLSNKAFCWNYKMNRYTMNECWQLPYQQDVNTCIWCRNIGHATQECPFYIKEIPENFLGKNPMAVNQEPQLKEQNIVKLPKQAPQNMRRRQTKCSNCNQAGHNRTKYPKLHPTFSGITKPDFPKCNYCQEHHLVRKYNIRKYDLKRNLGKEKIVEQVKKEEGIVGWNERWPDLEVAKWVQEKKRKEEYIKAMEEDKSYNKIYKDLEKGGQISEMQIKDSFLYGYKRGGWKLIIPDNFDIRGMSAKEFLLHEAHNNTGHGGLQKTYSYLTEYYSWNGSYQDTQKFVFSYNLCQLTKGTTQLPVGLLTPLTVPTRP